MAYRRSLITRASLLTRRRLSPLSPFSHSSSDDNNNDRSRDPPFTTAFKSPLGFTSAHSFMIRNMSSMGDGAGEGMVDMAEVLSDQVVEGVTDQAVAAVTPVVSEVAIAAADSAFPVAALQYLIDGVHSLSGCNWWASIALTTLLIRGATLPLLIDQLKSTSKLSLMRPELEEIKQEMQDKDMDPKAVTEGNQRIQAVFKKYGCTPFTPLKGLLFQGPVFVSFFLAISNMVEKVPSFKEGGAFWFVDLTTPDSLYILPALTALSFWITVECNMQEGMEGNPAAKKMKNLSRVFAVVTVPITMNFPKALFCYWVTSNLFSLTYGLVLKAPGVKKFLNVPEIPVAPPPTTTKTSGKPQMSVFESMTKFIAAQKLANTQQSASSAQHATSLPTETSKSAGNQNVPSSAVLSEKLRRLERQVKGKKNNKKL